MNLCITHLPKILSFSSELRIMHAERLFVHVLQLGDWSSKTGLQITSSQTLQNSSLSIDLDRVRIVSSILVSYHLLKYLHITYAIYILI